MTPEERKLLITTHLASRLKELLNPDSNHWVDIAEMIMNGWTSDASDDMMKAHTPLWEIIAPLVDGIAIFREVDHMLAQNEGRLLTREVREAMMLEVGRTIATHSTTVEIKGRISRVTSTARVWGGQASLSDTPDDSLGIKDYKDGAGV